MKNYKPKENQKIPKKTPAKRYRCNATQGEEWYACSQSNRDGRKSRIKAQKKIKRTNSNLENLEQRNTAEHSGTKKSMPEDAQVSLAIMVKLCLRWRFSMDSKEIRDLVQAYVKANKKLEGAAGNHLRKYCRDRG